MNRSVSAWHLRRARLEDAAEIARLMTELGYPIEAAEILPRLQALLVHPDHLVTVAAGPNDHLSGVIMAEHRVLLLYGPQVEIMGLSVGSDVRRMGVGHALVKAVEAWARQFGTGGSPFARMSSVPNHILFTRRLVTSARRRSTSTPGR